MAVEPRTDSPLCVIGRVDAASPYELHTGIDVSVLGERNLLEAAEAKPSAHKPIVPPARCKASSYLGT